MRPHFPPRLVLPIHLPDLSSHFDVSFVLQRPIVMTLNAPALPLPIANLNPTLVSFRKPSHSEILRHMALICHAEGAAINLEQLQSLVAACKQDLRHTLMVAQLWCAGSTVPADRISKPASASHLSTPQADDATVQTRAGDKPGPSMPWLMQEASQQQAMDWLAESRGHLFHCLASLPPSQVHQQLAQRLATVAPSLAPSTAETSDVDSGALGTASMQQPCAAAASGSLPSTCPQHQLQPPAGEGGEDAEARRAQQALARQLQMEAAHEQSSACRADLLATAFSMLQSTKPSSRKRKRLLGTQEDSTLNSSLAVMSDDALLSKLLDPEPAVLPAPKAPIPRGMVRLTPWLSAVGSTASSSAASLAAAQASSRQQLPADQESQHHPAGQPRSGYDGDVPPAPPPAASTVAASYGPQRSTLPCCEDTVLPDASPFMMMQLPSPALAPVQHSKGAADGAAPSQHDSVMTAPPPAAEAPAGIMHGTSFPDTAAAPSSQPPSVDVYASQAAPPMPSTTAGEHQGLPAVQSQAEMAPGAPSPGKPYDAALRTPLPHCAAEAARGGASANGQQLAVEAKADAEAGLTLSDFGSLATLSAGVLPDRGEGGTQGQLILPHSQAPCPLVSSVELQLPPPLAPARPPAAAATEPSAALMSSLAAALEACSSLDLLAQSTDAMAPIYGAVPFAHRSAAVCRMPLRPGQNALAVAYGNSNGLPSSKATAAAAVRGENSICCEVLMQDIVESECVGAYSSEPCGEVTSGMAVNEQAASMLAADLAGKISAMAAPPADAVTPSISSALSLPPPPVGCAAAFRVPPTVSSLEPSPSKESPLPAIDNILLDNNPDAVLQGREASLDRITALSRIAMLEKLREESSTCRLSGRGRRITRFVHYLNAFSGKSLTQQDMDLLLSLGTYGKQGLQS